MGVINCCQKSPYIIKTQTVKDKKLENTHSIITILAQNRENLEDALEKSETISKMSGK